MKRLLLVLFILIGVSSAFAADLKITGDASVRGNMDSNFAGATSDERTEMYFDYDFNFNAALVVNENATVFTKLTFDRTIKNSGRAAFGDGTLVGEDQSVTPAVNGSYALNVERAYINYKFAPFLQLNTGLMAGGQWASTFADTEINVMRVQFIGALSEDMIFIATYQKDDEKYASTGNDSVDPADAEKDDSTTYYLSSILKFGPLKVTPLLIYNATGVNYDGAMNIAGLGFITDKYDVTTMAFDLGLNGDFGMVGFESEFVYKKVDADGFADDHAAAAAGLLAGGKDLYDRTTYGAYVNVFAKVDIAKVGLVYAYASSDATDGTFDWGEDFDICVVMDDNIFNDVAGMSGENLKGYSVYKLYGEAVMDKITAKAAVAYGADNASGSDSTFTEIDLGAAYAFDANTTYSIDAGYAMLKDTGYDATAYTVKHKMSVKF